MNISVSLDFQFWIHVGYIDLDEEYLKKETILKSEVYDYKNKINKLNFSWADISEYYISSTDNARFPNIIWVYFSKESSKVLNQNIRKELVKEITLINDRRWFPHVESEILDQYF